MVVVILKEEIPNEIVFFYFYDILTNMLGKLLIFPNFDFCGNFLF